MNESEIATDLKKMGYLVDRSTVSRDLKAIKEDIAQQFIFDLARFDLAYYYKSCLDVIDQVKREAKQKREEGFRYLVVIGCGTLNWNSQFSTH